MNEQASFDLPLPQHRRKRQASVRAKDGAFAEAMRDARDVIEWRLGPNAPEWRIFRLAQAMAGQSR